MVSLSLPMKKKKRLKKNVRSCTVFYPFVVQETLLDSADEGLRQSSTKLMHKDMELAEVRHQAMQAKMEAVAHKKKVEALVIFVVLHGAGCSLLLCVCAVCADCTHFCRNCG
jgi:hypothetical protein